ncbi:MAG TPA: DUF2064 domain-containing protein [Thermoanaerobaculia bacterium]
MSERLLVVFARAPRSEARDKGLPEEPASSFFAAIAQAWTEAARLAGARVAISAPPEDLAAWRHALPDSAGVLWIVQRGGEFGSRLEDTVRRAERLAGRVVVTGGDVVPAPSALCEAFRALDAGADAILAPAPDGGVSILALPRDPDLLRSIGRRRRDVFEHLQRDLSSRGRDVAVVTALADVDGPGALRNVAVPGDLGTLLSRIRRACRPTIRRERPAPRAGRAPLRSSAILRGPPAAA